MLTFFLGYFCASQTVNLKIGKLSIAKIMGFSKQVLGKHQKAKSRCEQRLTTTIQITNCHSPITGFGDAASFLLSLPVPHRAYLNMRLVALFRLSLPKALVRKSLMFSIDEV